MQMFADVQQVGAATNLESYFYIETVALNDFLQVIYLTPTGTHFSVIGHYLGLLLRIDLSSFYVTSRLYRMSKYFTALFVCRWDIPALLKKIPNLGAVIDLTNTSRYYNPAVRMRLRQRAIKIDIVVEHHLCTK